MYDTHRIAYDWIELVFVYTFAGIILASTTASCVASSFTAACTGVCTNTASVTAASVGNVCGTADQRCVSNHYCAENGKSGFCGVFEETAA